MYTQLASTWIIDGSTHCINQWSYKPETWKVSSPYDIIMDFSGGPMTYLFGKMQLFGANLAFGLNWYMEHLSFRVVGLEQIKKKFINHLIYIKFGEEPT